ncbi:hypothetical protein [Amycolatopsis lexingtonensis]|uniref:hypothetical protein n=1 Tax=Amycolatopsis lexingtonensis TaxID=218822 RepID=UPI003F71B84D
MWERIYRHLPWVKVLGVTAHWLRYTTLTWVERNFSYAVAVAYAGHSGPARSSNRGGVTLTYTEATIAEVAAALSALTGEPHPLAVSADVETIGTGQEYVSAPKRLFGD